eukprot:4272303-Pleurochrysis_carterae.AAC.1
MSADKFGESSISASQLGAPNREVRIGGAACSQSAHTKIAHISKNAHQQGAHQQSVNEGAFFNALGAITSKPPYTSVSDVL